MSLGWWIFLVCCLPQRHLQMGSESMQLQAAICWWQLLQRWWFLPVQIQFGPCSIEGLGLLLTVQREEEWVGSGLNLWISSAQGHNGSPVGKQCCVELSQQLINIELAIMVGHFLWLTVIDIDSWFLTPSQPWQLYQGEIQFVRTKHTKNINSLKTLTHYQLKHTNKKVESS